jgi:hypothetical protein
MWSDIFLSVTFPIAAGIAGFAIAAHHQHPSFAEDVRHWWRNWTRHPGE